MLNRTLVSDVQQRANIIQSSMSNMPQGGGGGGGGTGIPADVLQNIRDMYAEVRQVRSDTSNLINRPPQVSFRNLIF